MKIFNLTQHKLSPSQIADGAFEPNEMDKKSIQNLLTFEEAPSVTEMETRANELMEIAKKYDAQGVLLAGAPYFCYYLKIAAEQANLEPMYSFTKREAKEEHQPDGTIKTSYLFNHTGFFKA